MTLSRQLDTENVYSTDGTQLVDSYGPAHSAMANGTVQTIRTHTHYAYNEGAPTTGGPYHLVTSQTVSASLGTNVPGTSDVDARTTSNKYSNGSDTSGWTLGTPLQTITDPTGLAITQTAVFNTNPNLYNGEPLQTESRQPAAANGGTAGDIITVYYTAGTNSVDAACGNQPNWADLVCKTKPAAQPGTAGMPNLPVTQYTYNVYLETAATTQTNGTVTRTTTITYDAGGRATRNSTTTTGDTSVALPTTVAVYSPSTGTATDEETVDASNNVIADIKTSYDDFGQTATYTDADGAVTNYTFNVDGTIASRSDSNDTLSFSYEATSGRLTQVADDADSLDIYGTYNFDGQIAEQQYSGNMVKGDVTVFGDYTYDSTGTATKVVYSDGNWSANIADSVVPNAAGDWTSQSVLNSSQVYSYDAADRLTGVTDTQAGQCATRGYTYDADTNRLTATSAAPAANGACQNTNPVTKTNSYDAADRLVNTGYVYDQLGRITTTPSIDAGGSGDLTATYYANDMVASQTQNGRTLSYILDPLGNRVRTQTDNSTSTVTTNHYAGDTDSPSWSVNASGWTENMPGVDGQLSAQVTGAGAVFQLADLHGDTMAIVNGDAPAASDTGPGATFTYSEFGAAESGTPGTYGWLGTDQRASALGGTTLMGERVYNSVTGRFNQVDPVAHGSSNAYDYVDQNPVTGFDLSGRCHWYSWSCLWRQARAGFVQTIMGIIMTAECTATLAGFGAAAAAFDWLCAPVAGIIAGLVTTEWVNHGRAGADQMLIGGGLGWLGGTGAVKFVLSWGPTRWLFGWFIRYVLIGTAMWILSWF